MPPDQMKRLVAKCSLCAQLLKWVPVAFIVTIITWSYYAYVVQLCFLTVESLIETVCYLFLYHAAFAMFVWSYWQTIFTPIGSVPPHFILHPHEAELVEAEQSEENQRQLLENFARDLPVACRTENGAIRYCEKCRSIKPDRAHHCSICGTCVLKMDHHCPWINNCVCYTNYKFFVLFLGYGLLYCFLIFATTTQYFVQFWTHELENQGRYHIVFLFFVSVMFGISLISLFGYHSYLVLVNRSTLESFRPPIFKTGPNKLGFNLGWRANFIQVFGENRNKWFLPVNSSSGDGVIYPERQANPVNAEAFVY